MAVADANLLVFQYRRGNISAEQFINEMRDLNYSSQQITQIIAAANNPRAPAQLNIPEPAGNVLPPETYRRPDASSSFSTTLPGPGQTAPLTGPSSTPAPSVSAPLRENYAIDTPYYIMNDLPPGGNVLGQEQRFRPQYDEGQAQRFRPQYDEGQAQRFRPMPEPTSASVVRAARQALPAAQPAQQAQPQQSESSGLMQLIRGDFREGADQRIAEAMRRQREESGIEGKAEGGATTKKSSRDDVLHKALEIIHHMLTRR